MTALKVSDLEHDTPGRDLMLRLQAEYLVPTTRFSDAGIMLLAAFCEQLERRIVKLEQSAEVKNSH